MRSKNTDVLLDKRSHFAGGVLTPPLTKGDAIAPFGNPIKMFPPQEAGLTWNQLFIYAFRGNCH